MPRFRKAVRCHGCREIIEDGDCELQCEECNDHMCDFCEQQRQRNEGKAISRVDWVFGNVLTCG